MEVAIKYISVGYERKIKKKQKNMSVIAFVIWRVEIKMSTECGIIFAFIHWDREVLRSSCHAGKTCHAK